MSPEGSVTDLFRRVRDGDPAAARDLWERYCQKLVALARNKLGYTPRRMSDEDDIANRAYQSLCLGARRGRFPDIEDRESLWRILVFITVQKVADQIAHDRRMRRGGGKVRGESVFEGVGTRESHRGIDKVIASAPGPGTVIQWVEEYRRLLDLLKDDELRAIAELRVQSLTIDEIATKLGRAKSTIRRKLDIIRAIWEPEKSK
jgi:DNA-directed RNA polymerase specialized sigma24 family protein